MKPYIHEGDFSQVIHQAITEGRHVDYLKQVLKDYEDYKRQFDANFTDQNSSNAIYKFRATYLRKLLWRDIEILGRQKFSLLAEAIIDSMGWVNDHMHGFSFPEPDAKNRRFYSLRYTFYAPYWEDDPHPTFKSNEISICDIDYTKQPKLRFIFDFGDGHEFDVELKKIQKVETKGSSRSFPHVVDQRGIAPMQYPPCD